MNYHVINQYLAPYVEKGEEKTFAGHVDYFKQNNQLSMTTVVDQWSKLNNENKIKVGMKTAILCPHLNSIKNGHIINQFGTMVVNADNTINMAALKDLLKTCFKKHHHTYIMTQSTLFDYLKLCQLKWEMIHHDTTSWYALSQHTLAALKWREFFSSFADIVVNDQPAVTIDTLLLFYFDPISLYQRAHLIRI